MEIRININTDNAAFEDYPDEIERVFMAAVTKVVSHLQCGGASGLDDKLFDINGNTAGRVSVKGG